MIFTFLQLVVVLPLVVVSLVCEVNLSPFPGTLWEGVEDYSRNVFKCTRKHLEILLPVVDDYIVDIKDTNDEIYQNYTGRSNHQVLGNLRWLIEHGKPNRSQSVSPYSAV
jgi:hypothetical protein